MHIRYTVHFYGKYNVYDSMYECSGKKSNVLYMHVHYNFQGGHLL